MNTLSFKTRFQFSIRDVLWFTVLAALSMGWLVDHRMSTKQRESDKLNLMLQGVRLQVNKCSIDEMREELQRRDGQARGGKGGNERPYKVSGTNIAACDGL
jgi:hypothetical protein